jgi:hypothetical protein
MILMASWEFSLRYGLLSTTFYIVWYINILTHANSVSTIGLVNGGTAGAIWMFFICWSGFMFVNVSMAEMASMYATSSST